MIYDINGNGCVSVDETMNILYHRYGKAKMEVKIKEIFGERKDSGLEGGEIGFARFLASFSKSQEETYWNTSQGTYDGWFVVNNPCFYSHSLSIPT